MMQGKREEREDSGLLQLHTTDSCLGTAGGRWLGEGLGSSLARCH